MSEYVYCSDGTPLASAGGKISLPRERIVRCKDCARYEASTVDEDGEGDPSWCWKWQREWIVEDGFCAWGERKGE